MKIRSIWDGMYSVRQIIIHANQVPSHDLSILFYYCSFFLYSFTIPRWASALFVVMPTMLLLNDAVKATGNAGFLPQDGPMGFIGRL
jgi:hypothetical protein